MPVLSIDPNKPHPKGWVLTRLQEGDELASYGTRRVDPAKDLSRLYGVKAQEIVENNGVIFAEDPINQWVVDTGGMATRGGAVFTSRSVIYLPAGGPRPAAGSRSGGGGGGGWLLVGLGLAAAGGIYLATRKGAREGDKDGA